MEESASYLYDTSSNYRASREERIRLARESCAKNYYGDKMKSRKEILMDLAQKEKMGLDEKIKLEKSLKQEESSKLIQFKDIQAMKENSTMLKNQFRYNDESKEKYPSYVEESKNDFVHTQIREKPFWDSRLVGGERKNQFYEENGQQLAPTLSYEEEPLPVIPSLEDSYYEYEPVVSIHDNFLTGISNAEQEEKDEVLNKSVMKKEVMSFRILAVRCFFALLILAGVILADKMNLSYKNHTADLIKTALHSNKEMNKVEDMLMDLTKSSNP